MAAEDLGNIRLGHSIMAQPLAFFDLLWGEFYAASPVLALRACGFRHVERRNDLSNRRETPILQLSFKIARRVIGSKPIFRLHCLRSEEQVHAKAGCQTGGTRDANATKPTAKSVGFSLG
jgi:hypothetical protein